MIILDTHIWIWWVNNSSRLTSAQRRHIELYSADGLGISIISCWEVAKAFELGRLELSIPIEQWLEVATHYPNVRILPLTLPIVIESTRLQGFHRDPGDQFIVATSRIYKAPLLTADEKIIAYAGANTLH
jgi:PIN domain nuclease of toxin-antitoxin system